jgi:hypothetical protein
MISASITKPGWAAARPGHRFGLIDEALAPLAAAPGRISPEALEQLKRGLAVVVSAEALFVLTDLCGLSPEEAIASEVQTARSLAAAATKQLPPGTCRVDGPAAEAPGLTPIRAGRSMNCGSGRAGGCLQFSPDLTGIRGNQAVRVTAVAANSLEQRFFTTAFQNIDCVAFTESGAQSFGLHPDGRHGRHLKIWCIRHFHQALRIAIA